MSNREFNPEIKAVLDRLLLGNPLVESGMMFGYPAYYVHHKLFACVYNSGVGIKVPIDVANELLKQDAIIPFVPMGKRKMKEWIQINRIHPIDYRNDAAIFAQSIAHVAALSRLH